MLAIVLTVVGVLFLGLGAWLRLGRTSAARSWVGGRQLERTVLVTLPLVGVACLGLAVMQVSDGDTKTLAAGVVALAVVVFLLFNPVGLPLPRWTLPGWYRTRTADRRRRARRRPDGRRDRSTERSRP